MSETKRKLDNLVDSTEKIVLRIARSRIKTAASEIEVETAEKARNNCLIKSLKENESLGAYVVRTVKTFEPKTPVDFYIYWLAKNSIVDISKIELFCEPAKEKLKNYQCASSNEVNSETKFKNLNRLKFESAKDLSKSLEIIENFKTTNSMERRIKKIYFHIKRNFTKDMVNFYSESDFLQKFWSPVFEAFFAETVFITHWGDTKSWSCKKEEADMKLDFRLVLGPSKVQFDTSTGEFARQPTPRKLYKDRLKSTIAAKATINDILKNSSLTIDDLHSLKIPIIQVMGFECEVFVVALVEPKLYTIEKVHVMNFPVTNKNLRNNGIEAIIQGLAFVEELSLSIQEILDENKIFKVTNKMEAISSKTKPKTVLKKEWTTKVKWFSNKDFEE
ncbi:hypothetical protein G6F46_004570 [Rhizopus delemar]|uniref:Uncharacterized protein n=2 Tax=Rhizopus TaxID=4842 RepID=A0A9P6ZBF0_9FUNG|nr:hypothetical protein G6F43_009950 [Rhizopus delemar]KAG1542761.1 hypothetical protein G6F51_007085 [Rhizopus arrhizus]KAG1462023.1 hypothetical protein G6F55_003217 [Rhizopus delemar]KAG1492961.1 hypothetical protein G6F54_008923 [Rhizopus delemar]KAG1514256.1 hypothetical protein G6F53_003810 [Rhizopus delemar]